MRRLFASVAAGFLLALVLSAPALAQVRDPFDPLVTDNGSVQPGPNDNAQPNDNPFVPDDDNGSNGNHDLPYTGSEVSGWVVLAYGLGALGTLAICIARLRTPIRIR
jgi:hypothetical protein